MPRSSLNGAVMNDPCWLMATADERGEECGCCCAVCCRGCGERLSERSGCDSRSVKVRMNEQAQWCGGMSGMRREGKRPLHWSAPQVSDEKPLEPSFVAPPRRGGAQREEETRVIVRLVSVVAVAGSWSPPIEGAVGSCDGLDHSGLRCHRRVATRSATATGVAATNQTGRW